MPPSCIPPASFLIFNTYFLLLRPQFSTQHAEADGAGKTAGCGGAVAGAAGLAGAAGFGDPGVVAVAVEV
jgi:hypothetical protein